MKKGFTLIELLAVIIILAIVALIATPIILDVIEDSRKSANKSQVELLLDGLEQLYANNMLVEDVAVTEKFKNEENVYDLINTTNEKPADGLGKVNNEGKTAIAVTIDGLCYYKGFDDSELTIKELAEGDNCLLPPGAGEYLYQCKYYDFWKHEATSEDDFEMDPSLNMLIQYTGDDTDIIIPCEVDGVPVEHIGEGVYADSALISWNSTDYAFLDRQDIKSVIIPDTVKSIGTWAFRNTGITSIKMPNSLIKIGESAFMWCSNLTEIDLGETLESIAKNAFYRNSFESIVIPASVKELHIEAFEHVYTIKSITFKGRTTNDLGVFYSGLPAIIFEP